MNIVVDHNKLAKDATAELIKDISTFLCKAKVTADKLKYNLDKCDYDTCIVCDLEEGLLQLGVSLADLLRYWDDEDETE
jgi:hypothetical protein